MLVNTNSSQVVFLPRTRFGRRIRGHGVMTADDFVCGPEVLHSFRTLVVLETFELVSTNSLQ